MRYVKLHKSKFISFNIFTFYVTRPSLFQIKLQELHQTRRYERSQQRDVISFNQGGFDQSRQLWTWCSKQKAKEKINFLWTNQCNILNPENSLLYN